MGHLRFIALWVVFALFPHTGLAKTPPAIPEPLKPWLEWVLHGHEAAHRCAPQLGDEAVYRCVFSTGLALTLNRGGGGFEQTGRALIESWVPLVGDERFFPRMVTLNGAPAVVITHEGIPQAKVPAGPYSLKGALDWAKAPEYLRVPAEAAIVSLSMEGRPVDFPDIDEQGRLWLKDRGQEDRKVEDTLHVQSYRLIEDLIPPRIQLFLQMDVAGTPREILVGPAFSHESMVPVSLESPLPARVEPDGRVRLQVRPGRWSLTLTLRSLGALSLITFENPDDGVWPNEEIWSFSAQNQLRMVEIKGPPAIDPLQTSLPESWRRFPAYRLVSGQALHFNEIKRGDPQPAPDQLSLERNLWLRFDGTGFTLQDHITGRKYTDWRLEMTPEIQLGRVVVDGSERFITRLKDSPRAGIELRKGTVQLSADSTYHGSAARLPLTGWDHDFQKVVTRLFLPPGYRLIHATGMDDTPRTWWTSWTLLDLFVVLVFTFAVAKLYSKPLALIAFITMALSYQEPGAPRWVWVALLAGFGLLKFLPDGYFKRIVRFYQGLVALSLALHLISFAAGHLRTGIYPQLEIPSQSMAEVRQSAPTAPSPAHTEQKDETIAETAPLEEAISAKSKIATSLERKALDSLSGGRLSPEQAYYQPGQVAQYDPSVVNQTGPGLPAWQWRSVVFNTGPSQGGQTLRLMLTGPVTNLILAFLRVALMGVLVLGLFGIRYSARGGWRFPGQWWGLKALLAAAALASVLSIPVHGSAQTIPSPEMLEALRSRLLEKEACFPNCADIPECEISITREALTIRMRAASQTDTAIPLPGNPRFWLPREARINDSPADALYRTASGLWMLLPAGTHTVELKGRVPALQTFQLSLPLKPHRVKVAAEGWTAVGLREDGSSDNQIQFKRLSEADAGREHVIEGGVLPPFAQLERTLLLGLEWRVQNRVLRQSPAGSAVALDLPLLEGESIITPGFEVKNGRIAVQLDSQRQEVSWESVLPMTDRIRLRHEQTHQWTELWRADVSPVFHMTHTGIPVILHQQGQRWAPQWHPWPGEEVVLSLSRPSGVPGQTLTIDRSRLEVRPGQRATDSQLTLSIRSSQGGQHPIGLPEDAELQEVRIGGKVLPIRQEKNVVQLPVTPGPQEVALKWRSPQGVSVVYKTPWLDLGIASVNSHIDVHLPSNRWPLWFRGPRMGPAVVFWSVVVVILLVSAGLSRTGLTPLKFRHWLLLGIGMSQGPLIGVLWVVGWLMALDLKTRTNPDPGKSSYNVIQCLLVLLTAMAVAALVAAISQGLLGHPDMNIRGNGSSAQLLRWYQDHAQSTPPRAVIFSFPMLFYRLAMLAWALWVAAYLIFLLKWAWRQYNQPIPWAHIPRAPRPPKRRWGGIGKSAEEPKTANAADPGAPEEG